MTIAKNNDLTKRTSFVNDKINPVGGLLEYETLTNHRHDDPCFFS
jgi:hypothetical protein